MNKLAKNLIIGASATTAVAGAGAGAAVAFTHKDKDAKETNQATQTAVQTKPAVNLPGQEELKAAQSAQEHNMLDPNHVPEDKTTHISATDVKTEVPHAMEFFVPATLGDKVVEGSVDAESQAIRKDKEEKALAAAFKHAIETEDKSEHTIIMDHVIDIPDVDGLMPILEREMVEIPAETFEVKAPETKLVQIDERGMQEGIDAQSIQFDVKAPEARFIPINEFQELQTIRQELAKDAIDFENEKIERDMAVQEQLHKERLAQEAEQATAQERQEKLEEFVDQLNHEIHEKQLEEANEMDANEKLAAELSSQVNKRGNVQITSNSLNEESKAAKAAFDTTHKTVEKKATYVGETSGQSEYEASQQVSHLTKGNNGPQVLAEQQAIERAEGEARAHASESSQDLSHKDTKALDALLETHNREVIEKEDAGRDKIAAVEKQTEETVKNHALAEAQIEARLQQRQHEEVSRQVRAKQDDKKASSAAQRMAETQRQGAGLSLQAEAQRNTERANAEVRQEVTGFLNEQQRMVDADIALANFENAKTTTETPEFDVKTSGQSEYEASQQAHAARVEADITNAQIAKELASHLTKGNNGEQVLAEQQAIERARGEEGSRAFAAQEAALQKHEPSREQLEAGLIANEDRGRDLAASYEKQAAETAKNYALAEAQIEARLQQRHHEEVSHQVHAKLDDKKASSVAQEMYETQRHGAEVNAIEIAQRVMQEEKAFLAGAQADAAMRLAETQKQGAGLSLQAEAQRNTERANAEVRQEVSGFLNEQQRMVDADIALANFENAKTTTETPEFDTKTSGQSEYEASQKAHEQRVAADMGAQAALEAVKSVNKQGNVESTSAFLEEESKVAQAAFDSAKSSLEAPKFDTETSGQSEYEASLRAHADRVNAEMGAKAAAEAVRSVNKEGNRGIAEASIKAQEAAELQARYQQDVNAAQEHLRSSAPHAGAVELSQKQIDDLKAWQLVTKAEATQFLPSNVVNEIFSTGAEKAYISTAQNDETAALFVLLNKHGLFANTDGSYVEIGVNVKAEIAPNEHVHRNPSQLGHFEANNPGLGIWTMNTQKAITITGDLPRGQFDLFKPPVNVVVSDALIKALEDHGARTAMVELSNPTLESGSTYGTAATFIVNGVRAIDHGYFQVSIISGHQFNVNQEVARIQSLAHTGAWTISASNPRNITRTSFHGISSLATHGVTMPQGAFDEAHFTYNVFSNWYGNSRCVLTVVVMSKDTSVVGGEFNIELKVVR